MRAKDAFLLEIYRGKGLALGAIVNEQNLAKDLKKAGVASKAFIELQILRNQTNSWLRHAIDLRNQGTHRHRTPRIYNRGIVMPNVRIRHPTDAAIDWEAPDDLPDVD